MHDTSFIFIMTAIPHLDRNVKEYLDNIPRLKMDKNKYVLELVELLDLYLLNVMEEEDHLYKILCVQPERVCNDYNTLKTVSPFNIQLNILMSLPFNHSDIQVEEGDGGFIKLKLSSASDDKMQICSKISVAAFNRGIQNSLLRHVNTLWRDKDNYFQSMGFLKWFSSVVDKSLALAGPIPNYKIVRLQNNSRVTLRIQDEGQCTEIFVHLLPVFSLPINKLPESLYSKLPQDSSCNEWMAECCSNEVSDPQLWATSFWQHEKKVIKEHNLKPFIQILKGVRDIHCEKTKNEWNLLTNNHIRNLVMISHKQNLLNFQNVSEGKILLDLLLILRNHLVSSEGLPSFWDGTRNLLCGMTGFQKSSLARLVTRSMKDLQNPNSPKFFGLETYAHAPVPALNTWVERPPQLPSDSASRRNEQISSNPQTCSLASLNVELRNERSPSAKTELVQKNGNNNGMWWIVAGVATVAIAALAGSAILPKRKKNDD